MRARPLIWFALGVVVLVGIISFWRLSHRPIGSNTDPTEATELHSRPQRVATTNATTIVESTAPAILTGAAAEAKAKTGHLAHRLSNTTRTVGQLVRDDRAVLLENALIDTAQPLSFSIPEQLRAAADPGSYIVQARGVVTDSFRAALAAAGATIVSYIPNNAFLVRASTDAATQLQASPHTQAVLPFEPVYKLKSDLLGLALSQSALPPDTRLNVLAFPDAREEMLAAFQQRGLTVLGEDRSPFGTVFTVQPAADTTWIELARLPEVEIIEMAAARIPANDISRVLVAVATETQTDTNHLGLTGAGITVNVNESWSSSLTAPAHLDLAGRVLVEGTPLFLDASGHATHLTGIIAGNGSQSGTVTNASGSLNPGTNTQFRGMAPNALIHGLNYSRADSDLQESAASTNALISNNSWSYAANTYGLASSSYDAAVRDAVPGVTGSQPLLFVFAAGNSGGGNDFGLSGNAESVLSPATAKNVITVGAVELPRDITNVVTRITGTPPNATTNTSTPWKEVTSSGNEVAWFSSRGNVGVGVEGDYGRFKPDVVAPGTFVLSTRSTTWDERAYYNPTSHHILTFRDQLALTNTVNNYSIFLPDNAVGFSVRLIGNQDSPSLFPRLPIFVRRDDIPDPVSTREFVTTNVVSVPPDAALGGSVGQNWYYSIGNYTTQDVSFDIITDVITTNDLGDYHVVLSNLNNSIGIPPHRYRYESGTSMSAANASGTLALIQEFFEKRLSVTNSPALMKALLINGARSVGELYDHQVQNTINYQGWGLVKLANSVPFALTNYTGGLNTGLNSMLIFDQVPTNALATGESQTWTISVNTNGQTFPLRITLTWTDPPGNPAAGLKLVNDLDLVVTNRTTGEVYFGNDIPVSSTFTPRWETNVAPKIDLVNNVENVYLAPALGAEYAITVLARRVNVNAVTAHPNDVVQDFALVISSGNGEVQDALRLGAAQTIVANTPGYPEVTGITNQFGNNPEVAGGILLDQHVGANTPLLGTGNGITNQWHFYVITNTAGFTNAAFVTFLPPTLSVPRGGVNEDDLDNASRVEADIDLYVSRDSDLTNLAPAVVNAAEKSRTRVGTEFIVYSNAQPNEVYYIGVKSEDSMAAEYALFAGFSLFPFSETDEFGNIIVRGFPLPSVIEDGSPSDPGAALVLGLAINPSIIRRVIVTNSLYHENLGDLVGALSHDRKFVVLNNHRSAVAGQYQFIYEDNDEEQGRSVYMHPDGPGRLRDFVGDPGVGVWLLSMVDDSLSQTGQVNGLRIRIEPSDTSGDSTNRIRGLSFFYEVIDVPVGATNLQVCIGNVSAAPVPVELYLRYEAFPTRTAYDHFKIINPPGDCLSVTPADLPPLRPGRYIIGVFNPSIDDQDITIRATVTVDPFGVSPINWNGAGNQPILDDAVGSYTRFVTNVARIAQLEVGLRIDHPRISDLAVTLISPRGTRVLLVENRGATDTNGFGSTLVVTNFFPIDANGSNQPQSEIIETGATSGTLTIDYDFFDVPDQMTVYYQGALLWDSGMISGSDQQTLAYGPGSSTQVTIIMNEFGNTNAGTLWEYTVSSLSVAHSYLTFTENTNLTSSPIKFAVPPFLPPPSMPPVTFSDFEFPPVGNTNGTYFGPRTSTPDGWNVMTTDPVTIATNPPMANTGEQSLVLRSGQLLRNLPTTPLRNYRLNYAYRQVPNLEGLVSWWPGELTIADVVGGNTGTNFGVTYASGQAGQALNFNGVNSHIRAPDAPNLDFTNAMTMELWVNPRFHGADRSVVQKWGGVEGGGGTLTRRSYGLNITAAGIPVLFVCADGGTVNTAAVSATNALPVNEWTHLAGTYDGNNLRFYVNGELHATTPWNQGIFPGIAELMIGAALFFSDVVGFYDGQIDELALYHQALTATQINNIYAAGASGKFGLMFPPDYERVSTNYPFRRAPVGGQIYVSGQTNSFLGDSNWQSGGLIFRATSNLTAVGLSPVVTGTHYYQFIRTNISWASALATAAGLSTNGLTAHLATITSAEENEFIRTTFATNLASEFAWIGGRDARTNRVWRWDAGPEANLPISTNATALPPFNFVNWAAGEPNNLRTNDHFLMFNLGTDFSGITNGQWADAGPSNSVAHPVVGYLVEFEPIPPIQSGVMVDTFTLEEAPRPRFVFAEESLDILKGENAFGEWRLEIWDSRTGAFNQVSLLDWQMQFVFITNSPAARGLRPCEPFTTTIPPGQIFYYTVDVPAPARFATNFLYNASAPLGFYFNQNVPPGYGATNVGDVAFTLAAQNQITLLDATTSTPLLLPGQRYYLAIENSGSVNVSYTLQVCFDLLAIPPSIELTNRIPFCAINPTPLGIDYYRFVVSTNARRAQFEIIGPSGDMTLLVRRGLPPTFGVFDYFSANPFTNAEMVTVFDFDSPVPLTPGDWYLGAANLTPGPVTYCIQATEWFEYGTNVAITNVTVISNSFCITWTSLPGVNYFIEGLTDVTSTNWVTVSPTITAIDYATTYCVPLPSPFQFFRVREGIAIDPFRPPPVITSIERVLTGFLISWSGPTDAAYNVQWTSTLNTPPPIVWTTFTIPPTVTSVTGLFQFLDDGSQTGGLGAIRFYRLLLLP